MTPTLGNCPVVDAEAQTCLYNGLEISCKLIRECDGQTGAQHVEYAMPFGNDNANIWVMQADGTFVWNGPWAPTSPPPTLPAPYTPTATDTSDYSKPIIPTVHASVIEPAITPQMVIDPPYTPPPPSGSFTYTPQPAVINPNLGPTSGSSTPAGAGSSTVTTTDRKESTGPSILDDLTSGQVKETLTEEFGQTGIPVWLLIVAAAIAAYMAFKDKR
jgi:hypothetical protein